MAARQGALAAGAARASGERAKRRSTPLIGAEPIVPADAPDPTSDAVRRAGPARDRKASAEEGGARRRHQEAGDEGADQEGAARPRSRHEGVGDEAPRQRCADHADPAATRGASRPARGIRAGR